MIPGQLSLYNEGCAVGRGGSSAVALHGNRNGFFWVLFVVWHCANTAEKKGSGNCDLELRAWHSPAEGWGGREEFGIFRINLLGPPTISSLIILHSCLKGTPLSFLHGFWSSKRK